MKKILSLLFFISIVFQVSFLKAQNLGTESFFNFGTKAWETVTAMITDTDDNYYVAGTFSGTMDINGIQLVANGQRDVFLIKYSNTHQLKWAKNYGGEQDDNVYSLTCDALGNIYLAGSFQGDVTLDNIPLVATSFTDIFYAKLDYLGNVIVAKNLSCEAAAKKVIIHTDTDGNIWLAGSFEKTIALSTDITLQAESGSDIFFAKYDIDGNLLLQQHVGGLGDENLKAFEIDNDNNIYLAGSYERSIKFDANIRNSVGKLDYFIEKYDLNGVRQWYRTGGGSNNDEIKQISCDNYGHIYMAGEFEYEISIGPNIFTAAIYKDVFLMKRLVSQGSIQWLEQFGGSSSNTVSSIVCKGNDKFYLSGKFTGEMQTGTNTIESEGKATDAYIARYTKDGIKEWVNKIGGKREENLFLDYNTTTGSLFAYGYFSENLEFLNQDVNGKNYKDIYFGQLVDCGDVPGLDLGNDTILCAGQVFNAGGEYTDYLWGDGLTTQSILPEQSGVYTLTVADEYGCRSTDEVLITIIEPPLVDLGEDIVAAATDTIILSVADTLLYCSWTTGDTTHSVTLPMTLFELPGTVGVTAGATNRCTAYDEIMISMAQATPVAVANNFGNDDFSEEDIQAETPNTHLENAKSFIEYKIYPNPNNGRFHIGIPNPMQVKQVDIFDSKGNRIKTFKNIERNLLEIDVSNYAKGVYIVYISEEESIKEFKIIFN